ncbi:formylglycine-generating enzyme family protein [Chondromyces crocatus]|uniref:formylglycine-generating enzyme family protein n=1 Tax=Chondromyces crocatus TaxID=52 RepID=UPI001C54F060|nr:SUMF1/EgtB/PvdO family nonheme iron enzyme [Chondromyces crocatus]
MEANPNPYCIDSTEVTIAQYLEFVDASALDESILDEQGPGCSKGDNESLIPEGGLASWWNKMVRADANDESQMDHPVRFVDWCDATAYCKWAGKRLCGARAGGPVAVVDDRIDSPKDAQWFHACTRGGSQPYPYGARPSPANVPSGICRDGDSSPTNENSLRNRTAPVGSLAGCEGGFDGLFDMSGNAAEWIDSCALMQDGVFRCATAGGTYSFMADACFCEFVEWHEPKFVYNTVGFRCCSP